jgi:hypothetical protein
MEEDKGNGVLVEDASESQQEGQEFPKDLNLYLTHLILKKC